MIDKPGLYEMSMDEYLRDPTPGLALSSGCLHTLLRRSPFHAWCSHPKNEARLYDDASKDADIGSVAHSLLLERDESRIVVIDAPDFRTKAAREARDAARAAGKHAILQHRLTDVRNMRDAALEHIERSELSGCFHDGLAERVAIAEEDGVWLRARPDWLTSDYSLHVSFKTTPGSAAPEPYIRWTLGSQGYDTALAFYDRVIHGAVGVSPDSFLLVQETSAPYQCVIIGLAPDRADIAERQVARGIDTWRTCCQRRKWPSYSARIHYAEAMPWEIASEESKMFTEKELEGGIPL